MTIKTRFTLIGTCIIIFLIITPVLTLFARGFKIDWQNRQIIKTGTLIAKTQPAGANIYLNGKNSGKTSPATIRFLNPDDYDIKVEKDGYFSWSKRLPIRSQLVTWINLNRDFVTLFYDTPRLVEAIPATAVSFSKTKRELVFQNQNKLHSYNLDSDAKTALGSAEELALPLSDKIKWSDAANLYKTLTNKALVAAIKNQADAVKKFETNGNFSAFLQNNTLYKTNLTDTPEILEKEVSEFALDHDRVWFVKNQTIIQLDLATLEKTTVIQNLPAGQTVSLIRAPEHLFAIIDDRLFFVNDGLEKLHDRADYASWDEQSKTLVFGNDNEIFLFYPEQKKTELLYRSTSSLLHPWLNDYSGYVFFSNENKIKAVELDGRNQRNLFTLLESGLNFSLDQTAKKLLIVRPEALEIYQIR